MDETSARHGHRYVTVFIDLDKKEKPVVFATPGKGKETEEKNLPQFEKAIHTAERYKENILASWSSEHNNGRIEALNGIFQAAKARAREYRNCETFISIIYLLASPIQELIKFHTI
jgi:transposase